jgi:citrate synthase
VRGTLAALAALTVPLALATPAPAQTTAPTTAPPATTVPPTTAPVTPTTAPVTPTTAAPNATTTTAGTEPTATTEVPLVATQNEGSDDGGIPWLAAVAAIAVLGVITAAFALWARRRGAARQAQADWRQHAAETTASAGATARLLATGTAPTGAIAQQLLTSLRAFEDLADTAPDDVDADAAERARRAIQTLGLAIDADYRVRRAQPPVAPDQLEASAASVRDAAAETDRTLRGVYRGFTESD